MTKSQRLQAIVLRRTNYGEADRILQLLTPVGKISVIARGVRREKSRLSGGIELFALCEIVVSQGKGNLDVLTSSRLIKFYDHIIADYDRLQFGYEAIKIVSRASEHVDDDSWFDVLLEVFAGLDSRSVALSMVQTWFYLHYSSLVGYELSLWRDCAGQEIKVENKYRYDIAERGLVADENGNLTSEHIKLLRLIFTKSLKVLAQIDGVGEYLPECLAIARAHAAIQTS